MSRGTRVCRSKSLHTVMLLPSAGVGLGVVMKTMATLRLTRNENMQTAEEKWEHRTNKGNCRAD